MREIQGQSVLFIGDRGTQKITFVCFDDGCCGVYCDDVPHSVWKAEQLHEGLDLFLRTIERNAKPTVHRCQKVTVPHGTPHGLSIPA